MSRIIKVLSTVAKVTGKTAIAGTTAGWGLYKARRSALNEQERQELIEGHRGQWDD